MHIRLIAPYIAPGAAEPVAALTAFFLRRGDDVRLFTVDAADELPPALAQLGCTRVADAAELARSPDFAGADLYIFCVAAPHPLLDAIFALERGVVILYHALSPALAAERLLPQKSAANLVRLANAADLVVVESQADASRLRATGAAQPGRLYVIPPPVSLADFSPAPPDAELRRSLDLLGRHVLLAMPPAHAAPRLDELAAFMRRVHARLPNTVLALAGETPFAAADLGDALPVVRLPSLAGPAQPYRLADAFIALDDDRTSIRRSLEAAACGLPLIDLPGDALAALLAEQEAAPRDAADTAARLFSDDAFYGTMARRSLDLAARHSQEAYRQAWSEVTNAACGWLPLHQRAEFAPEPAPLDRSRAAPAEYAAQAWTLVDDLEQLKAMARVMLADYRVRSPTPYAGPLIAWVRRNLTSHLREPYIDPTLQRQEAFNLRAVAGLQELAARLAAQRRSLDETHQVSAALRRSAEQLAAQVDALLDALPAGSDAPAQQQIDALRRALTELRRLLDAQAGRAGDDAV